METSVTKGYTSDEKFVHDYFTKIENDVEKIVRAVGQAILLRKKVKAIGGDTSGFDALVENLQALIDQVDEVHYEAMGHVMTN